MSTVIAAPLADVFTVQDHAAYTADQHAVWSVLYARRMQQLEELGSRLFLDGANTIGLRQDAVPDLHDVNRILAQRTGWRAQPVRGFIPADQFFNCLAQRIFPTTVTIRPMDQLDYLPEPDIFHDVFGHVPLHADPVFADFLQRFGQIAARARTEEQTLRMARLFWFTVEFGLVRERGEVRIYGSGLISSAGDAANALSDRCERRPFSLEAAMSQHFEIDQLQPLLFVIESFEQLFEAVALHE
jgi:phenylalanine-4-hydroxylase